MSNDQIKFPSLLHLAWRDFWRHPKAGSGSEGKLRLFFLNRFPALLFILAMALLVWGTYFILGVRLATDRLYDRELSNPFIWWVSVMRESARDTRQGGSASLLPQRFWRQEIPYMRYGLHLVPQGSQYPVDVLGRTFQPEDPVLEAAARGLDWPPDRERFLRDAQSPGNIGIIMTRFLYSEMLGFADPDGDTPQSTTVAHKWSDFYPQIDIPVLGIVDYLPDGEFLISEQFVEPFVRNSWQTDFFLRNAWFCPTRPAQSEEQDVQEAEQRMAELGKALHDLEVDFESVELTAYNSRPAIFARFPSQGVAKAKLVQAVACSPLAEAGWRLDGGGDGDLRESSIRYDRMAYVLKEGLPLIEAMVKHCRLEGLRVDASILLRADALTKGRRHFLRQSLLVLLLNWAAALALLLAVTAYKTHRGIHGLGVYLAMGGRPRDGYLMAAMQFAGLFATLAVLLLAFARLAFGGNEPSENLIANWPFLPWHPSHALWIAAMAAVALASIQLIRAGITRRLWPSQMILYRD